MQYKILKKQNNSDMCAVCGTKNDASLKSVFYELEGGLIAGIPAPKEIHQSYPNRMHGGMICALLDETLGRAVQIGAPDVWAVTGELSVRFKKPVPLDKPIVCVGKITRNTSRVYVAEGFIEDERGEILATAKGTYVKCDVTKICDGNTLNETNWFYVEGEIPKTLEIKNSDFFHD